MLFSFPNVACYNPQGDGTVREGAIMSVTTRDIRAEIDAVLDNLSDGNLKALLDVLHEMRTGAPLRRWSPAVGSISQEDAELMLQAIEEGCERIEPDEW